MIAVVTFITVVGCVVACGWLITVLRTLGNSWVIVVVGRVPGMGLASLLTVPMYAVLTCTRRSIDTLHTSIYIET